MFIGLQAVTNLAVVLGLLPTKGLTLPFLSFGGSSLLVNCAAVGILLNVSRPRRASEEGDARDNAALFLTGPVAIPNPRRRKPPADAVVTAEGGLG
jgi:cell division protein FtsW